MATVQQWALSEREKERVEFTVATFRVYGSGPRSDSTAVTAVEICLISDV